MTAMKRYSPWAVVTLGALYLAYCAMPARQTTPFDLEDFGAVPVHNGGRMMPLDSLARNTLLVISGRQTYDEEIPEGDGFRKIRQPAIKWLLDVWRMRAGTSQQPATSAAADYKVFRIENLDVLNLMGLEPRPGSYRYSLTELQQKRAVLFNTYEDAKHKEKDKRDLTDEKVGELVDHLMLFNKLASFENLLLIPPEHVGGDWYSQVTVDHEHSVPSMVYDQLLVSCNANDPQKFNNLLEHYRSDWLKKKIPSDVAKAQFETFFNRFAPFYDAIVLYIFVFLLACLSWMVWPKELAQSAFALGILTLLVHTWALIARMYMMDRWFVFVTNLYATGIFIGWGCAVVGLFLEYVYGNGIGAVVGSVTGSLSLIIAHFLSLSGDTLGMIVAVLDTNFWLATHVTCINFGYAAAIMAGFMGIAYIVATLAVPKLSRETAQDLTRMTYGVVCFATLLSFTGTVLGGIWADQSWGRFWGWDPKENGALLIVLMNALILHARWGGMIKSRGLAVLAVLGNIVVAWSWFGVNMLGVGLHSYGFMEGAAFWLIAFVISQLVIAGIGMFEPSALRRFFAMILALDSPAKVKSKVTT